MKKKKNQQQQEEQHEKRKMLLCNINYYIKNYLINDMYILRSPVSDDDDCKSANVNTINK